MQFLRIDVFFSAILNKDIGLSITGSEFEIYLTVGSNIYVDVYITVSLNLLGLLKSLNARGSFLKEPFSFFTDEKRSFRLFYRLYFFGLLL